MGADLLDVAEVGETVALASEVLGYDVADLLRNAPAEKLNDTLYAQPATCVLSVGIARALMARGVAPQAVLGFSLGQVSALAVSGMLTDAETFALVAKRAELMARSAKDRPGVMSALLKATPEEVERICDEAACGQVLVAANFNSPGQIVISGEVEAVERAEEAWAAAGKRFARLATSGAFHSPLMHKAAEGLDAYLSGVTFKEPVIPVICNTDACEMDAESARARLVAHLTHPVLFQQSVEKLSGQGIDCFAEVGFGGVLSNLVKRIERGACRPCVQDRESFDAFVGANAS